MAKGTQDQILAENAVPMITCNSTGVDIGRWNTFHALARQKNKHGPRTGVDRRDSTQEATDFPLITIDGTTIETCDYVKQSGERLMLRSEKKKAVIFQWQKGQETGSFERLQYAAACKLCIWHYHAAGGGSQYVTIGGPENDSSSSLKLRFADHENTSEKYPAPDFNFVSRLPSEQELQEIENRIQYAKLCKKTAFALHVGLTVPKMKTLLTPECLKSICENEYYSNTYTEYVVVATALQTLEAAGVRERIPVRQERHTTEDYNGY